MNKKDIILDDVFVKNALLVAIERNVLVFDKHKEGRLTPYLMACLRSVANDTFGTIINCLVLPSNTKIVVDHDVVFHRWTIVTSDILNTVLEDHTNIGIPEGTKYWCLVLNKQDINSAIAFAI